MDKDPRNQGGVAVEEDTELKHPDEYLVILLNDDYTTQDFVVMVLMDIFHRDFPEAYRIMMDVHRRGRGVVGTYSWDIANTKVGQVHAIARANGFPLKCVVEKV